MTKSSPDEKWKRFNKRLEEPMKENDFFGLDNILSNGRISYKEGGSSSHMRQKGYEMKLKNTSIELSRLN